MNTQTGQDKFSRPLAEWLSSREPLSTHELCQFIRQLATLLNAWHARGFLHGRLVVGALVITHQGRLHLVDADPAQAGADFELDDESCPPELRLVSAGTLPRGLEASARALAAQDIHCDPRRIDTYQLAALAIRVATGGSAEAYLQRPQISAKIPPYLRTILDRALGIAPTHRLMNCVDLLRELEAAGPASSPAQSEKDTPAQGISTASDTDPSNRRQEPAAKRDKPATIPYGQLGKYKIVGQLGSGGMGDVFKGYDAALDRFVAIKVLPEALARQEAFVARFRAEATAAAKLEHPHIVPIYEIGSDAGRQYFAMQFVDGQTLGQLLSAEPHLDTERVLRIVEQIVSGLALAHRLGMVHRDIKPGNILLADSGRRALLTDFGLVKSIDSKSGMTATGVVMGTVDYLSPEQGRGQPVDGRSDLYSIGVLLYQMLAGKLPFTADSLTAMIFQHVYEPPRPLAEVAPQVSLKLARIVHRLLAKNPEDRPQSCEELLADLAEARGGESPPRESTPIRHVEPRTSIIRAPKFVDEPKIAGAEAAEFAFSQPLPKPSIHDAPAKQARRGLLSWLSGKSPRLANQLANTQMQVDLAVLEYERRCEKLKAVVREAQDVQRLLRAQIDEHEAAASEAKRRMGASKDQRTQAEARAACVSNERVAEELRELMEQQRGEIESMQLDLTKANGRLAALKMQRDALQSRLKFAQAESRHDTSPGGLPNARVAWIVALVLGVSTCIVAVLVVVAISSFFGRPAQVAVQPTELEGNQSRPAVTEAPPPGNVALPAPIHRWTFDEGEGDAAGDTFGQNKIILGFAGKGRPRWVKGHTGNALEFTSADHTLTTEKYVDHENLTIAFWLRLYDYTSVNPRLAHPWVGLNFEVGKGVGVMGGVVDPKPPVAGQWEHYAATIDQRTRIAAIYRNGVLSAHGQLPPYKSHATVSYWAFGHNQDPRNPNDTLNGVLDEVQIFDRILSAPQVRQLAMQPEK